MENTDFYMPTEQPVEEVYIDTSEKILALSDRLAEEIILENITDQLEEDLDTLILTIQKEVLIFINKRQIKLNNILFIFKM